MTTVLKLTITGVSSSIDIYEAEPGKLVFEVFDSNDPTRNTGNGYIEADTNGFLEKLNKLVSK